MNTWILLRGLTRENRHWGDFPALLGQELPGARVLPLELPGNGQFHGLVSPATIGAMAEHCRLEAARLGASPPHNLLAMSMGAMVATAWAEAHAGDIARCVLVNTSFAALSPPHHRLRPRAWPSLASLLLERTPEGREGLLFDLTCNLAPDRAEVIAGWAAIRRSRPVSLRNAVLQLLAAARYRSPPRAPAPTLVLAAAADRLVDPRCSRAISAQWHCALAVHPEAGHDLPLDDGPWVAGEVRKWLETWQKLP